MVKRVFLIGGNLGIRYEDNAAVFHNYLSQNHSEKSLVYWMYDKKYFSNDEKINGAVPLGSIKNYYLFFNSDFVIYSHSLSLDIGPFINKFLFLNKRPLKIHVSHGIEGLKRQEKNAKATKLFKESDYLNCISDYEKNIKEKEWGVNPDKLIVTGMPRFDNLTIQKREQDIKHILFFPTWREWLIDKDYNSFCKSNYYVSIINLIKDKKFLNLLSENDIRLKLILHPFFVKFKGILEEVINENYLAKQNIDMVDFEKLKIQKEIIKSDVLITDYSSIAWDFYYLNKPIIFYQFDQEEYLLRRGSYLDFDNDLFGYKTLNTQDTILKVREIIYDNEKQNSEYYRAQDFFTYFDDENCERLYEKLLNIKVCNYIHQ